MKKLLLILLLTTPFIGFGQGCQYGSSTDASELCDFYRGNNFATYRNADIALDKILDVTGMSKRFVLKECNDISNCVATAYNSYRIIEAHQPSSIGFNQLESSPFFCIVRS